MRNLILATMVVFIGTLPVAASACGNQDEANSEENKTALGLEKHDQGAHQMKDGAKVKNGFKGMPAVGTKAVCPVMGNEFTVTKDTTSAVYKGKTYVFCCPGCKPKFEKNPAQYVKN